MPLPPLYWRHLPVVAALCFPSHQPNPARASPEVQTCKKTGKWKKKIWKTKGRKLPPSPTSPTFKGLPLPLPLPFKPQVFASHFAIIFIIVENSCSLNRWWDRNVRSLVSSTMPDKMMKITWRKHLRIAGQMWEKCWDFSSLSDFSKSLNQFLTYHTRDGSKNWRVHWFSIYVSTYFV